jgi:hypothetical protein
MRGCTASGPHVSTMISMRVWVKALLSATLMAALTAVMANAEGAECSEAEIAQAAALVDLARKALIALPMGDGKVETPQVSLNVQVAIETMKTRLGRYIDAYMRCAPIDRDAAAIQRELSERAHALLEDEFRDRDKLPKNFEHYGFELDFAVRRWADHPSLVGVVANFQIECGSDAIFLIFSGESGPWTEIMRWRSEVYKTIAGAFGDFDYRISPTDELGNWYVLVKSIDPNCSSAWADIRYAILRPGANALTPKIIDQTDDGPIFWAYEDFGQLTADRNDYEIRFHSRNIDDHHPSRIWIRRFNIVDNTVERIPPVALSQRDFVDEWIQSTWEDAESWTEPDVQPRTRAVHKRLSRVFSIHNVLYYSAVSRCADRDDHYQVGVVVHRNDPESAHYFFSVVGQTDYRLTNVTTTPDPACDGPDISGTMDAP